MWDKLSPLQEKLVSKCIVDLSGDVDDDMALYVRTSLTLLYAEGAPDISVHITSNGGNTHAGLDIYDMLRAYSGKTTGKVLGFARSAASILLQGCTERWCTQNGTILIHHPRFTETLTLDDLKSEKKISQVIAIGEASRKAMYAAYEKRTSMTRTQIRKLCLEDRDLTADEALKFGLIDQII